MTATSPHLEARVTEFLRTHRLLDPGSESSPPDAGETGADAAGASERGSTHLLVAASGGCDSTVLAHLAARIGNAWHCRVTLATVHHGLRPEADAEVAFVRALAGTLGTGFLVRHVDVHAEMRRSGSSVQDAARTLRYDALEEMCDEAGASVILTAHHADDQAETLLAHFLRGAGPDGLAGIRPLRGRIARPLLRSTQEEIHVWAETEGISWMHDASNDSDRYRRNALRHHVAPAITQVMGSGWVHALGDTARVFEMLSSSLLLRGAQLAEGRVLDEGESVLVRGNSLNDSTDFEKLTVCRYALRALRGTEATLEESLTLLRLLDADAGTTAQLRGGASAVVDHDGLHILPPAEARLPLSLLPGAEADWGHWHFTAEDLGTERPGFAGDAETELIDLDAVGVPWQLRQWTQDDRFEPLGFGREKNVGTFLADSGYPFARRRRIPVLAGPHGIIWICGVRLAQHAALRGDSRHIGRIRFSKTDKTAHDT